jgi:hypothetical protein
MCVIIVNKNSTPIPKQVVHNSVLHNPDGFGIRYLDNGETTRRLFVNFIEAENFLNCNRPYVAHFRKTTKGGTTIENVHPVYINTDEVLFHNGTLNIDCATNESDTVAVARLLKNLGGAFTPHAIPILELSDSRFVAVNKNNDVVIANKAMFTEKEGVLYSKDAVLERKLFLFFGSETTKEYYAKYNPVLTTGTALVRCIEDSFTREFVRSKSGGLFPKGQILSVSNDWIAQKTKHLFGYEVVENLPIKTNKGTTTGVGVFKTRHQQSSHNHVAGFIY